MRLQRASCLSATARSSLLGAVRSPDRRYKPEHGDRARRARRRAAVERFVAALLRFARRRARARQHALHATESRRVRRLDATRVTSLAWLDIIRDSTLVAPRRRRAAAESRSSASPSRGSTSSAPTSASRARRCCRAHAQRSESTNQVALGAFPPTSYRAARFTGRSRVGARLLGTHPTRRRSRATPISARRKRAQRATVLSLVSDVASGYLQLLELDQERAIAERTLSSRKATLDIARAALRAGTHVGARRSAVRGAGRRAGGDARAGRARARADRAQSERAARRRPGRRFRAARRSATPCRRSSFPIRFRRRCSRDGPTSCRPSATYAASVARIGVADAARLPTFSIVGSYGSQAGVAEQSLRLDRRECIRR